MLKLKYTEATFAFLPTIVLACALMLTSCESGDPPLPATTASFDADALGFEGSEATFKIVLSAAAEEDIPFEIGFGTTNLTYGTHFTTQPAAVGEKIALTIPAGASEGAVKVTKTAGITFNGDEKILFVFMPSIGIEPGAKLTLSLSFGAITSEGSTITANGKTEASPYANTVYLDFSSNSQVAVDRKSWNLGFLSGTDFKVVLNPGYQTTAAPLTKSDINAVTIADAETILNLSHDAILTDPATVALADAWTGDLSKTTFAAVAEADADNKVYLLSCEGSKNKDTWFKVKITRNGSGYKVLYARIGETTIKTIDVPKKDAYNMTFVSLEKNAIVDVEPPKRNWDIEWAYSTNNSGLNTPYWTQDFILLNYLAGAEAAELVSTGGDAAANATAAAAAYTAYNEAAVSTTTFLKTRDVIGSKWRLTAAPGVTNPGVRKDRFYVVKDPSGNIYKIKFISFGVPAGDGERGKPVVEYKLVKKAN